MAVPAYTQDSLAIEEIATTVTMLNRARREAGLDTVIISATLSKGCSSHAKYLVMNRNNPKTAGLNAHKEFSNLQGYTKEGEIAAKSAVIHFVKPTDALEGWIQTFYHRIPLLQPGLREIGIGFYEKDGYTVSLLDCISGTTGQNSIPVVYYPNVNQNGIPLSMGPEIPNPVGQEGSFGFPITIYFTQFQKITNVSFKLTDKDGKTVDCYVSTPENPATNFDQWNSICAIPKKTLNGNAKYIVTVSCSVNGQPFKKTYSFQTSKT